MDGDIYAKKMEFSVTILNRDGFIQPAYMLRIIILFILLYFSRAYYVAFVTRPVRKNRKHGSFCQY